MADRITRPTVRLAGGLPDGNLSNLEALGGRLLSDAPPEVHALVLITRQKREENDDQDGAELAIVKVRALEAFAVPFTAAADAVFPFDIAAGEPVAAVLQRLRADRTGQNVLPVNGSADAEYAQLSDLRGKLADYGAEAGLTDVELGRDVMDTVPGAGIGWRDSPLVLAEYLRTVGAIADPPAGGTAPTDTAWLETQS